MTSLQCNVFTIQCGFTPNYVHSDITLYLIEYYFYSLMTIAEVTTLSPTKIGHILMTLNNMVCLTITDSNNLSVSF